VVAGVVVLVLLLLSVGGQDLLKRKERAVMHFSGSIYGLQLGAPVVFRGVQVGTVASIDVRWDDALANYVIPVVAELDAGVLRSLGLGAAPVVEGVAGLPRLAPTGNVLAPLLQRGLYARLGTQSFVTGQLYVDLDLRPGKPARALGMSGGLPEIPTQDTTIQNLKNQLDGLDIGRLVQDITETARSVRELAGGPDLREGVRNTAQAAADIGRLARRIEAQVGPLADSTRQTLARTASAADSAAMAAQRIEQTAEQAAALLAPDSVLVQRLNLTAEEVARSASALRQVVDGDSPLLQETQQAARDVSRAARAVRELARSLDRQPEILLRGRDDEQP
jgi:paraquat-inducible protein B